MTKILSVAEAIEKTTQLRKQSKRIVLTGGCFDILHIGHLTFLEASKARGDILMLLLENDESIRQKKGDNRPINTQHNRARLLAGLSVVDYVIELPTPFHTDSYDELVISLKPAIITTTKPDPYINHKQRQATALGCKLEEVMMRIEDQSTTKLAKLFTKEL